jgi:hypothetical protein
VRRVVTSAATWPRRRQQAAPRRRWRRESSGRTGTRGWWHAPGGASSATRPRARGWWRGAWGREAGGEEGDPGRSKELTGHGRAGASRYAGTRRASWRCSWCPVAEGRASSSQRRARCGLAGGLSDGQFRGRVPPACCLGGQAGVTHPCALGERPAVRPPALTPPFVGVCVFGMASASTGRLGDGRDGG